MSRARRPPRGDWRHRLHEIVFEADTPAGRAFDVALLVAILASVAAVLLESVPEIRAAHGPKLRIAEWTFTGLFTVEYLVRLAVVARPLTYARTFFGVVDLLAILPTYLALLLPGAQSLLLLRALRLLRIFRIFKLRGFVAEAGELLDAFAASRRKILIFFEAVLLVVLLLGTLMYLVEGELNGFTSIPIAVYWAIVTMTTVGYGDLVPHTPLGRVVASFVMLLGYAILAVPTGIVSSELVRRVGTGGRPVSTQACPACGREGHDTDAKHCKFCGTAL
jgi:voltage-gated potassium channel